MHGRTHHPSLWARFQFPSIITKIVIKENIKVIYLEINFQLLETTRECATLWTGLSTGMNQVRLSFSDRSRQCLDEFKVGLTRAMMVDYTSYYFERAAKILEIPAKSGKFVPEDLDASLCTHVIYAFSVLDEKSLTLKIFDEDVDVKQSKLAFHLRFATAWITVLFMTIAIRCHPKKLRQVFKAPWLDYSNAPKVLIYGTIKRLEITLLL